MKERGLLFGMLSLLAINLASAFSINDYSNFSVQGILSNGPLVISFGAFLIFFPTLFVIFSRFFKENKMIPMLVSLGFSIIIIWGLNRGIDFSNITFSFINLQWGISSETLYAISPILLIIVMIFISQIKIGKSPNKHKIGFGTVMIFLGIVLILVTLFTNLFYEKGATAVAALFLIILGFILRHVKKNVI